MTSVRRLAYIELEVSDLQAWRKFAQTVLAAQVVDGPGPDTLLLRIDDRSFRIALRQGPRDDIIAIGLEADNRQGYEEIRAALAKAGYPAANASAAHTAARGVAELMTVTDPTGLALEFSYASMARPQEPFHPPRAHSGFVTGDHGLGHVMVTVPNKAEAQAFYEGVLGFRVSDYVVTNYNGRDASFVFLRCNGRHHTMAVGELPLPKRLAHFMLQCRDIDDVGRALDRVPASGLKQTRSLGRHINDKMISFYMETPSKVQVEYGHGGVEVHEEQSWAVATYDVTSVWGHKHL